MKLDRAIRLLLVLLLVALLLLAAGSLLFVTDTALSIWERLREGPAVLLWGYLAALILLAMLTAWLIFKLFVRRKPASGVDPAPPDRESIESRLNTAAAAGVDVESAREELRALAAEREDGAVRLCFFGEVSSGKSSLIKALVPDARIDIDVRAGSTSEVTQYRWQNDAGHQIELTDVPGIGGHEEGLDVVATDAARRAHLVLFVCDGDLSRPEVSALSGLLAFDKPVIVVLNKADRYADDELATLMERLLARIADVGGSSQRDQVVAVTAGGEQQVVHRDADGDKTATRQREADIAVLVVAINRLLRDSTADLDARREMAVFRIAGEKLDLAERRYRQQRGEQIIRDSTRKAVVGALAAVSPGTDVLIQGYIGTSMTQSLCALYGAAPRDLDIEDFLNLTQSRVGRVLPLSLAVSGNGLKAFPGIGTVVGGAVHAVAYGLIFDALGRSLVHTLERHGELLPEVAASEFEDGISEHLEKGVRRVARMALEEKTD